MTEMTANLFSTK